MLREGARTKIYRSAAAYWRQVWYLLILLTVGIQSLVPGIIFAFYQIDGDVLSEKGGESRSDNYQVLHYLGTSIDGSGTSESYQMLTGASSVTVPVLAIFVSDRTLNLGVLSGAAVSSDETILTVITNLSNGYAVFAKDLTDPGSANGLIDGDKKIADATTPNSYINLPGAGTEHFGITVTGNHADRKYEGGTKINSLNNTTLTEIGSYGGPISYDRLTVSYRAGISSSTPASDNYESRSTFFCTARL